MWLLNKLFDKGDQPKPRFAFQGTVNWMRGLAILCATDKFTSSELKIFYKSVARSPKNEVNDIRALESSLMSMHYASSSKRFSEFENPYDIVRSSIVSWYYCIYYAGKSMIAASSGADPQTHAKTAKIWQTEIVDRNLVKSPFLYSISNLTPENINQSVDSIRNGNEYDLNISPTTQEAALGAIFSYLKGTAEYQRLSDEEIVKNSKEFKRKGFTNFRKREARELRDKKLRKSTINFLNQAFRYRGKANYRDAIYLSYGEDREKTLEQFVSDIYTVAHSFSYMAAHYVSKRVDQETWKHFGKDISDNAKFELPFKPIEI